MQDPVLLLGGVVLVFSLGFGLAYSPGALVRSLVFKPATLAVLFLVGLGIYAAVPSLDAETLPMIAGGVLAAVLGAFVGFKLRRRRRDRI